MSVFSAHYLFRIIWQNRHTAGCTSPVSVVLQCKLVSGWGLRKRRSAPPYGPRGSGRTLCKMPKMGLTTCRSTLVKYRSLGWPFAAALCTRRLAGRPVLLPADDDRAWRVMDDVVADATHDSPSHLAQAASSHHDHCHVLFLGHLADYLARFTAAPGHHSAWYLQH